jgi:cytochrome bd-type quinol oxidase subunit 2
MRADSATAVPVHPVWSQQSRKRDFLASTSVADQGRGILGACWLVRKSEGDVRDAAYRLIPYLAIGLLIFLIVVFAYALAENLRVISRWLERPYLFVFPAIGVVAAIALAASVRPSWFRVLITRPA